MGLSTKMLDERSFYVDISSTSIDKKTIVNQFDFEIVSKIEFFNFF